MCYFAHLGVRIVDDRRRFPDPTSFAPAIQRYAHDSGLPLDLAAPTPRAFLAKAMAQYQLRFVFRVGHCACDWNDREFTKVKQLVSRLLSAREVKSVAFLFYMIDGPVAESEPSPADSPPSSLDITLPEFSNEGELKDKIFAVRRAAGSFPTTSVRSL
jgi:hypothetical protein